MRDQEQARERNVNATLVEGNYWTLRRKPVNQEEKTEVIVMEVDATNFENMTMAQKIRFQIPNNESNMLDEEINEHVPIINQVDYEK